MAKGSKQKNAPPNAVHAQNWINAGGYIKGFGTKFRVMDATHSPQFNISSVEMDWLKENNLVKLSGLIWIKS